MRVDDGAVEGVARGQHGVEARPVHPQQDGTQQRKQVRAALESEWGGPFGMCALEGQNPSLQSMSGKEGNQDQAGIHFRVQFSWTSQSL